MSEIFPFSGETPPEFDLPEQTATVNGMIEALQNRLNDYQLLGDQHSEERQAELDKINHLWPYHEEPLIISGTIHMPVINTGEDTEPGSVTTKTIEPDGRIPTVVNGMKAISGGFYLEEYPIVPGSDTLNYRVRHRFTIPVGIYVGEDTETPTADNSPQEQQPLPTYIALYCNALMNDVQIDEYPYETEHSVLDKAMYYFPSEIERLDAILTSGDDPATILRRLAKVAIRVPADMGGDDFDCLGAYLDLNANLDTAPHMLTLDESAVVFTTDNDNNLVVQMKGAYRVLANLKGLGFVLYTRHDPATGKIGKDPRLLKVSLRADLFAQDAGYDMPDAIIPLHRITDAWSLRDVYRQTNDT